MSDRHNALSPVTLQCDLKGTQVKCMSSTECFDFKHCVPVVAYFSMITGPFYCVQNQVVGLQVDNVKYEQLPVGNALITLEARWGLV